MSTTAIPWFGARKIARDLATQLDELRAERDVLRRQLADIGGLSLFELDQRRSELQAQVDALAARLASEATAHAAKLARDAAGHVAVIEGQKQTALYELSLLRSKLDEARKQIVVTEETALLQEAGIYQYRHPLSDAVAYERELEKLQSESKEMVKRDGGAVLSTTKWTVDGSESKGRTMVRDFSKLLLRAFNAEADNMVRGLRPYRLPAAIERLEKVASTIERLGKTMAIRISTPYLALRTRELELTADWLQKREEEKEAERAERERLREERKVQEQIERERIKLEKERQHYANALQVLVTSGDEAAAARISEQLDDVERAIADVDYRAANIRAGYVYVISNIGSFGEQLVKVGMTRRLDPRERIRELSDASVPFNFDIHALFFSKDAVGIESALHARLGNSRVNAVNRRREFFAATPLEVKAHLSELAGELLEFQDVADALEYRQSLQLREGSVAAV